MADEQAKMWYASKQLWVNFIGIVGILAQHFSGKELISMEVQASILAGVNMVLRFLTKKPVVWEK